MVAAVGQARARASVWEWLPLLFVGLWGIAAAIATTMWPAITVLAITVTAGVLSVMAGVSELIRAVRVRHIGGEELCVALAALLAGLTGRAIQIWSRSGLWVLRIVFSTYALVTAMLVSISAARPRTRLRGGPPGCTGERGASVSDMRALAP
jgi:uncharacterized membrane protein HdeD (DUF308 family)